MDLKIVNLSNNELPEYKTAEAAGLDLRAWLPEGPIVLQPMERRIIPTGLHMEISVGYEGQVRPRSGIAVKKGLTVINSPGTIDSDYRGDVGVPLINLSASIQTVEPGERIAQIVFAKHERAEITVAEKVEDLADSERGAGGFGHTGTK